MKVEVHPDVDRFLAKALPSLERREAENNLILGIASEVKLGRYANPLLLTIGGAAAIMTPPHQLILTRMNDDELDALIEHFRATPLPGVVGPVETATAFVMRLGRPHRLGMSQWIYECDRVIPPKPGPGAMRTCGPADEDLVVDWRLGFMRDTGLEESAERTRKRVREILPQVALWEDGRPVCMASSVGDTPHGIRVGMVYTPPELRGRGYASSLVAALTQKLLDGGKKFCFLYTDATNPTSNRIYQNVGYRKVCQSCEWKFDEAEDAEKGRR